MTEIILLTTFILLIIYCVVVDH